MEKKTLYAKPSATNINSYFYYTLSSKETQKSNITLHGKSFYFLRNLYLSASEINAYNGLEYSYFNPFSGIPNLANSNPGFVATVIPSFVQINNSQIVFDIPQQFFDYVSSKETSYQLHLDVIIENEAGYGLLSRDSYSYSISSWSGFEPIQKLCIKGIVVEKIQ
jgi:hypothetical protein